MRRPLLRGNPKTSAASNWPSSPRNSSRTISSRSSVRSGVGAGCDCPLRIAFTELIGWIKADYGLSEVDSYELLTKVARIHLNEMVDPNYVVVASIDKQFLPPRRATGSAGQN